MKNKKNDCVKLKHEAAAQIHADLNGLSLDKKREFWNDRYQLMKKRSTKQATLR